MGPPIRPLTQYGSAEEILNALPAPDEEAEPNAFEQAPVASEEHRKAYPWQLPPRRPTAYFALDQGIAPEPPALPVGEEPAALAAETTIEA
jgi:hypothetical protein